MLAFRIVPPSVPNATAKRLISCATAKRSTRQAAGPLTRYLPNVFKGNRIAVALWLAVSSSRRRRKARLSWLGTTFAVPTAYERNRGNLA